MQSHYWSSSSSGIEFHDMAVMTFEENDQPLCSQQRAYIFIGNVLVKVRTSHLFLVMILDWGSSLPNCRETWGSTIQFFIELVGYWIPNDRGCLASQKKKPDFQSLKRSCPKSIHPPVMIELKSEAMCLTALVEPPVHEWLCSPGLPVTIVCIINEYEIEWTNKNCLTFLSEKELQNSFWLEEWMINKWVNK